MESKKELRDIFIKGSDDLADQYNVSYSQLGQNGISIKYKYIDEAEIEVYILDKTPKAIFIECENYHRVNYKIQDVIKMCVYQWVNSYRSNYNKDVFIVRGL